MSALRPVRSPPLLILAYSRSNNTNARRMAYALFSALDLTFGTHFYLDFRFCSTLSFFKTTKLKTTPTPPTLTLQPTAQTHWNLTPVLHRQTASINTDSEVGQGS